MGILAAFMVPHPPLVIPEIGRGEEGKIQATAESYQQIARQIGELQPETIVVISPHQVMNADYFQISQGHGAKGDLGKFHAGHVKMKVAYDEELVEALCSLARTEDIPAGILGEDKKRLDHGTMVPLYFVNQYYKEYQVVRIGLSGLPFVNHYELGQCIYKAIENLDKKVVVIASGDLSHRLKEDGPYGYCKEGPEYDARIMDVMERASFGELLEFTESFCEKAGECGHRAFCVLAGTLDQTEVLAKKYSYEGTFGVGYGVCGYVPLGVDAERNFKEQYITKEKERVAMVRLQEDAYVKLARLAIEAHVKKGGRLDVPAGLPNEMYTNRAGVFVSLQMDGALRGCIGTTQAVYPSVAEEIIENAISASLRDPRFPPVEPYELDKLTISVDVLGDTEEINSVDQLDVRRYGLIVTRGHKRGLLLPNLDGVDTVEEQIRIAKKKAKIDEDAAVTMERFEVIRHFRAYS